MGVLCPCSSAKTRAATPADVTTWPTLKSDLANGRLLMAWATTDTAANTSTVMSPGTRRMSKMKHASSRTNASDSLSM